MPSNLWYHEKIPIDILGWVTATSEGYYQVVFRASRRYNWAWVSEEIRFCYVEVDLSARMVCCHLADAVTQQRKCNKMHLIKKTETER